MYIVGRRDMKVAVLLFNLGGPDSLKNVRSFLFNLFNDPAILHVKQPWRIVLAYGLAFLRNKKAQRIYKHMGGKSPLLENTWHQARALEKELSTLGEVRCFVGMRYWRPFIQEAWEEIKKFGPDMVVQLPLYPQFSTVTTGSGLTKSEQCKYPGPAIKTIRCFPANEGFIGVLAKNVRKAVNAAKKKGSVCVLFTAHGLPEAIVKSDDPYPQHCEQTIRAIKAALNLPELESVLCYQSRVGPAKWLKPSTKEEIIRAARQKKSLVIVPISFVSENAETLVELDIEYRALAEKMGALFYVRTPTAGAEGLFIEGLANMVKAAITCDETGFFQHHLSLGPQQ